MNNNLKPQNNKLINAKKVNQASRPTGGAGHGHGGGVHEKAKDSKKALRQLVNYLRPYWIVILFMALLSIGAAVINIFVPKQLAKATNELYYNFYSINYAYILKILMRCLIMYVSSSLLNLFAGILSSKFIASAMYKMRSDIKLKLDKLPFSYFDGNATGDILSRMTNDVDTIGMTLQESLLQIVSGIVTIIGVLIIMFFTNVWLSLVTLSSIPLLMFITIFIAKKSKKHFSATQKTIGELNGHAEETYSSLAILKLYEHEETAEKEFGDINDNLAKHQEQAQFLGGMIMPSMQLVNNISFAALCVIGGILAGRGSIMVGTIQEFLQYKNQYTSPLFQLGNVMNSIQSTLAASERVFEVLEADEEISYNSLIADNDLRFDKEIHFNNVDFSYVENAKIIDNLNLKVAKGDSIAIVGPTGAGKTTLVNLLMRFYELDSGNISIDGVDITDMSRKQLRNFYGMVLQDAWIFSGTIRDNIAYGKENATDEEIINACTEAHIHHYIMTLSNGYNTIINEDATNISSGQKQLLTIARAILSNPNILILDEATSNVDTRTEALLQKAMGNLITNRTSFIIAHRLSTIKNASKILVMNQGKIVEIGTHTELLAKNGVYYELYNSQFNRNAE